MSYPTLPTPVTPATPQRPVPGTYQQTPAPATALQNAPLFTPRAAQAPVEQQASPAMLPKLPPAASKNKIQTLSTEERAARTINDTLIQESRYPDLDSYLSRMTIIPVGRAQLCHRDLADDLMQKVFLQIMIS